MFAFPYFHTQVLNLQNYLQEMKVPFDDNGNMTNVTLSDICFSPLAPENTNCTIQSVLNYFQNSQALLDKKTDIGQDYAYHLHFCTR